MKKKVCALLMWLCLAVILLPTIAHADYALPAVNKKDTVKWSKLYDVETEEIISFQYEIPKNGAAVLIFYKTSCGNSQAAFTELNWQDWVYDDRINFYAVESTDHTIADIRAFQKEYASNITDAVTWLDSPNSNIAFDYLSAAGNNSGSLTFPLMVVCTEEQDVKTIRAIDIAVTDVRLLGHTLQELLDTDLGVPYPVPLTISVEADYDMAAQLADLTNQKRAENGLPALQHNKALTEAAMIRAAEMALYPSNERPDGTPSYTIIDLYMPNSTTGNCFVGYYCDTAEEFWDSYIASETFYYWYLAEYKESDATQVGAGCVYYNNTYYWAVAIANDSTQTEAADQRGQVNRRYTINTYLDYPDTLGLSPAECTVYVDASAELRLLGNAAWMDTPLIPADCDSEIKDSSGKTIATAAIAEDGTITVTAKAVGTGTLHVSAWPNQETPYTASITVTEDVAYKPYVLHTTVDGSGRIELSAETAIKDTMVNIRIIPDEGWWLASLNIHDAEGNILNRYVFGENEYAVTMPASDVTITAQFHPDSVPQTKYQIYEELWKGDVLQIQSQYAYANTTVILQYTPKEGQELSEVTVTDEAENPIEATRLGNNSYSFTMPACNVDVRAVFIPTDGYPIILDVPKGGGTMIAEPPSAKPSETVTVTLIPHEGYETHYVSTNLSSDQYTRVDDNTLIFTMPDGNTSVWFDGYFKERPATSGSFGDGLEWTLTESTLTISGQGAMGPNSTSGDIPWDELRDEIQTVTLEEGVADICSFAFTDFTELTHITIPASVEYIEGWAFDNCPKLTEITFAGSAPALGIESTAFWGITANVTVPANDRSWTDAVTGNYCGSLTWNHSWSYTTSAEPSCTEDGYSLYTCICGNTARDEITPTLGHDYTDGICTICGDRDTDHKQPITNPFKDVREADWFFAPVLWAVENNVTGGTSPNTFSPNQSCTRAQVVTFLWAANGKPEPASMNNPFTDVSSSDWYCKAVIWAVEQGITGGISPTEFGPEQTCTRAQIVTFLYAAAGKPNVDASSSFIDVADTDWYAKPVIWAAEHDVTGGIGDGMFGPLNTCTRAQVVTFLYKASLVK